MLVPSSRASDADREAALARLRAATVEGRLTVDELGERAERVEAAVTQRELARVTRDLPVAPAALLDDLPERRRERAVLSSLRRTGRWTPARRTRYTAILGSVDVDLRRATLPGPELDIELVSLLGTARLRVPPGVDVEVTGGGLLCSRDVRVDAEPAPPGAPLVRVRTRGLLGSSKVRCQPRLVDQLVDGARRLAELRRP